MSSSANEKALAGSLTDAVKESQIKLGYYEKALAGSLTDAVKESQIKLGYYESPLTLYYPLESLCHLFGTDLSAAKMQVLLTDTAKALSSTLGTLQIGCKKDRFAITVPVEGIRYVHLNVPDSAFLKDLIFLTAKGHATKEEILQLFQSHSSHVVCEETPNADFDFILYFADGVPDAYRYCFHIEGTQIIYHRFSEEDVKALLR